MQYWSPLLLLSSPFNALSSNYICLCLKMKTSRGEGWGRAAARGGVDRGPAAGDARRRSLEARGGEAPDPVEGDAIPAAGGARRGPAARGGARRREEWAGGARRGPNPNTSSLDLLCYLSPPARACRYLYNFPVAPMITAVPRCSAHVLAVPLT